MKRFTVAGGPARFEEVVFPGVVPYPVGLAVITRAYQRPPWHDQQRSSCLLMVKKGIMPGWYISRFSRTSSWNSWVHQQSDSPAQQGPHPNQPC